MNKDNAVKKILKDDLEFFESRIQILIHELKLKNDSDNKRNKLLLNSIHEKLIRVFEDSLTSKAKRIRPLFCYWILRCFSKSAEDYEANLLQTTQIALSIEILHNASLIIDDIEDGSLERREKSALHIRYGMPTALNSGSWMYFLALTRFPLEFQSIVAEALLDCHEGQALDLNSCDKRNFNTFIFSSSDERWEYYEKCVELKTSRLILLSAQCLSNLIKINDNDFLFVKNIIQKYGIIYQLFDDIKNLFPEFSGSKTNEDLKNSVRSAISIEYINLLNEEEKLNSIAMFNKGEFFEYIQQSLHLNKAIKNCFLRAENILNETSSYIQKYLEEDNIHCRAILEIFHTPFLEIEDFLSYKIKKEEI